MSKLVILAAGHGGGDSGVVALGRREDIDAIAIVDYAAHDLVTAGFNVAVVPHSLNLSPSVEWVNQRYSSGLAIEVHRNSGPAAATGIEAFGIAESRQRLAQASTLSRVTADFLGLKDRGGKPDTASAPRRLYWCRGIRTASLLWEAGFLTSPRDNEITLRRYGAALAAGAKALYVDIPTPQPIRVAPTPVALAASYPVLQKGAGMPPKSPNAYVQLAQRRLIVHLLKLDADGKFGPATRTAVIKFQIARWPNDKSQHDGIIGKNTWAKLLSPAGR